MSKKKIKLYDELKLRFSNHKLNDKFDLDSYQFSSHDMVEFAGAIGIKLLELAAENVNLIEHWENSNTKYIEDSFCSFDDDGDLQNVIYANKQSILDTIKQVV